MHALDEVLQHFFSNFEVGNHAIFQGPNRRNIAWCATQHALRIGADSGNRFGHTGGANGNNRWLIEHDTALRDIDQCVCRA